jgi:hypothetical protein
MKRQTLIKVGIAGVFLFSIGVWAELTWYPKLSYMQLELPAIQQEVDLLPGVSIIGVYDSGGADEFSPIMLLDISDRGRISLYVPTRASFSGGGDVSIHGIGECHQIKPLFVSDPASRQGQEVYASVGEVITHYDAIVQEAHANGICQSGAAYGKLLWGKYP